MTGKEKYQKIPIPASLDERTNAAITHADQNKKRPRFFISVSSALVAACLALFVLSNVPSIAANLANIPVLGTVVQFLQVGHGGTVTDGVSASVSTQAQTIRITFEKDQIQANNAPFYTVAKEVAPNRLIITLHGVRAFSFSNTAVEFTTLPFVRDVYSITYLDDSSYCFAVEFDKNVDYQVSEYKNPGYIELSLWAKKDTIEQKSFFVRTKSMPMGEEIAAMSEMLQDTANSITKTASSDYCLISKPFETKTSAEKELAKWAEFLREENSLSIVELSHDQNPA